MGTAADAITHLPRNAQGPHNRVLNARKLARFASMGLSPKASRLPIGDAPEESQPPGSNRALTQHFFRCCEDRWEVGPPGCWTVHLAVDEQVNRNLEVNQVGAGAGRQVELLEDPDLLVVFPRLDVADRYV